MTQGILDVLENKKVIVCCGPGGVGKTTVATGLALAGAALGRKVLALTIDPSRRLADTLGVSQHLKAPVQLSARRLRDVGIEPPGSLAAWMIDPQLVADRTIRSMAPSPEAAARLMGNRIYRHTSELVAGLHEYTAMEALHGFTGDAAYDLVVLDTPPSRHALDFLEGPGRLERFFDGRIFRMFLPAETGQGVIRRAASGLVGKVLTATFGEETHGDLVEYFRSFKDIFHQLNGHAKEIRDRLSCPERVAFLLITSPSPEALTEALFFRQKTNEMGLPFRGFVLNRSQIPDGIRLSPSAVPLGPWAPPALVTGMEKLEHLAAQELEAQKTETAFLERLAREAGEGGLTIALPSLTGGADDLPSLMAIADALIGAGKEPPCDGGQALATASISELFRPQLTWAGS